MAQISTNPDTLPVPGVKPLLAILAGLLATIFVASPGPLTPHMRKDIGAPDPVELPPLSQDAATALHLQTLGKWY
ncbi:MAG: hypothetical protein AAFO93_03455 [Pseudomonadota bacterium]